MLLFTKPPPWTLGLAVLCVFGCQHFAPREPRSVSFGGLHDGSIQGGVALADRGQGWVRARPGERSNAGVRRLLDALTSAAKHVSATYDGALPLRVGDISYPFGGRHPRHHSHRAGRDVDVVFYATDTQGRPAEGSGWLAFDRHGVAIDKRDGEIRFFDAARNWALVEHLLTNESIELRWIFCSNGVKAQLLAYAKRSNVDADVIRRARWILHQPSRGNPHNDHFHIRVACTREERTIGCDDNGPYWPWGRWSDKLEALDDRFDDPASFAAIAEPVAETREPVAETAHSK